MKTVLRWSFGVALIGMLVVIPTSSIQAARPGTAARAVPRLLPAPPTIPLIRVEASRDHVLVTQDLLLRRGAWTGGDIDAFVAFGAPGVPRAFDARLYQTTEEGDDLSPSPLFEVLPTSRAFQRPSGARMLLGSALMAGAILHIRELAFRRATQSTGVARVRIRTLLDAPRPDARTGREVLIRLGSYDGEPEALDSIEFISNESRPWVTRTEVHLCGPDADTSPLAAGFRAFPNEPSRRAPSSLGAVAPELSVRHASDDLCVRFWTTDDS